MPGSVAVASPTDDFPSILYTSLSEVREWRVDANAYANGEHQAAYSGSTSRKAWRFTARLSASALATLQAFWAAHGRTVPFYFTYRGTEYAAIFNSGWQQTQNMGRTTVEMSLLEVS